SGQRSRGALDQAVLWRLWMNRCRGYIFFFSSRRRHTRWPRDWSSDVCSSDLPLLRLQDCLLVSIEQSWRTGLRGGEDCPRAVRRSEERRVGKEGKARGARHHQNKKEKGSERR